MKVLRIRRSLSEMYERLALGWWERYCNLAYPYSPKYG